MNAKLRQKILRDLKSRDTNIAVEAAMRAATCFESHIGRTDLMHDEIVGQKVTRQDATILRRALVAIARSQPTSSLGSAAIFALSKYRNRTLKAVFVSCLRAQLDSLKKAEAALGNTIYALHDIGERVLSDSSEIPFEDLRKNITDSEAYLASRPRK